MPCHRQPSEIASLHANPSTSRDKNTAPTATQSPIQYQSRHSSAPSSLMMGAKCLHNALVIDFLCHVIQYWWGNRHQCHHHPLPTAVFLAGTFTYCCSCSKTLWWNVYRWWRIKVQILWHPTTGGGTISHRYVYVGTMRAVMAGYVVAAAIR